VTSHFEWCELATLKLKFDSTLDYQRDAVSSIVDLLSDLPLRGSTFSLTSQSVNQLGLTELGVSNPIPSDQGEFETVTLTKLRAVQERNGIEMSETLDGLNFSLEMETGTGKTYVYLRTLFELNKVYGFTKFVIVESLPALTCCVTTSDPSTTTSLSMPRSMTRSILAGCVSSRQATRSSSSS
jgi:restriction endonuclease